MTHYVNNPNAFVPQRILEHSIGIYRGDWRLDSVRSLEAIYSTPIDIGPETVERIAEGPTDED